MRKTTKMRQLETEHGRSLEALIRERIERGETWEQIAAALSVSRPTLFTWMCRLGGETVNRRSIHFASDEKISVG